MAFRVGEDEVRDIVDNDPAISITPFQIAANALTDKVSSNDADGIMTTALLAEVEKYLTAGFYAVRDQLFAEKKTADAFAVFQTGKSAEGPLNQNDYLRTAMLLDITGYLADLNQQAIQGVIDAGITWLGLPPSSQTDYVDRD